MVNYIPAFLLPYFIGAIPFGYIVGKICHVNILERGSGNIGFTNVMRVLGIGPGVIVLAFDLAKGYFGAMLGMMFAGVNGCLIGALAVILGHSFSCFLKFKGGKSVATGGGAVLFMNPVAGLTGVFILVICCLLTRYMSLGSIGAALAQPIMFWVTGAPIQWTVGIIFAAVYVIYKHKANIIRLMNGTENKIGVKSA